MWDSPLIFPYVRLSLDGKSTCEGKNSSDDIIDLAIEKAINICQTKGLPAAIVRNKTVLRIIGKSKHMKILYIIISITFLANNVMGLSIIDNLYKDPNDIAWFDVVDDTTLACCLNNGTVYCWNFIESKVISKIVSSDYIGSDTDSICDIHLVKKKSPVIAMSSCGGSIFFFDLFTGNVINIYKDVYSEGNRLLGFSKNTMNIYINNDYNYNVKSVDWKNHKLLWVKYYDVSKSAISTIIGKEGENILVLYSPNILICYDKQSNVIWENKYYKDYVIDVPQYQLNGEKEKLILSCSSIDNNNYDQRCILIDTQTGKILYENNGMSFCGISENNEKIAFWKDNSLLVIEWQKNIEDKFLNCKYDLEVKFSECDDKCYCLPKIIRKTNSKTITTLKRPDTQLAVFNLKNHKVAYYDLSKIESSSSKTSKLNLYNVE